jgi:hypothetical protein
MQEIKIGDGATERHLFYGNTPATIVGATISGGVVESITVAPERLVVGRPFNPDNYEFELIPNAPTRTYVFEDGQYRYEAYVLLVGARYWGDDPDEEEDFDDDSSINLDEPLY